MAVATVLSRICFDKSSGRIYECLCMWMALVVVWVTKRVDGWGRRRFCVVKSTRLDFAMCSGHWHVASMVDFLISIFPTTADPYLASPLNNSTSFSHGIELTSTHRQNCAAQEQSSNTGGHVDDQSQSLDLSRTSTTNTTRANTANMAAKVPAHKDSPHPRGRPRKNRTDSKIGSLKP